MGVSIKNRKGQRVVEQHQASKQYPRWRSSTAARSTAAGSAHRVLEAAARVLGADFEDLDPVELLDPRSGRGRRQEGARGRRPVVLGPPHRVLRGEIGLGEGEAGVEASRGFRRRAGRLGRDGGAR